MSGPWDNYAQPQAAQAGPWAKYGQQAASPKASSPPQAVPQSAPRPFFEAPKSAADALGPLEAAGHIVSGIGGQIVGGLAGLASIPVNLARGQSLPNAVAKSGDVVSGVQNALTYDPRTAMGHDITNLVEYPFQKLGDLAHFVGGKATDLTGSPAIGTVANTLINAAPMLVGAKGDMHAPVASDFKPTVSDAVANARGLGFKLTPTQAQSGLAGRVAESLSSHAKLERDISRKNAQAVDTAAGSAVGIQGPVTAESLNAAKAPHNAVYDEVASLGSIPTDAAYRQALGAIQAPGSASFPGAAMTAMDSLRSAFDVPSFDAADAVAKTRQLRADAGKNIKAPFDPERNALGFAQKSISDALESQIERNLQGATSPPVTPAAEYDRPPTLDEIASQSEPEVPRTYRAVQTPDGKPFTDSQGRPLREPVLDLSRDTLLHWLGINGGINLDSLRKSADVDPALTKDAAVMAPFGRVGYPALRRNGGMSVDRALERMQQDGWLQNEDPNAPAKMGNDDAASLIQEALNGHDVFHPTEGSDVRMQREFRDQQHDLAADLTPQDWQDMDEAAKSDAILGRREQIASAAHANDAYGPSLQDVQAGTQGAPVDPTLLARFRGARKSLAKIHSVEAALKAGKGQAVSAANLAKQLQKGAPLSGDLRTIAESAQNFPRAFQDLDKIRNSGPLSMLPTYGGLGVTAIHPAAWPALAGAVLGPPTIRALLGSELYQRAALSPRVPWWYARRGLLNLGGKAALSGQAQRATIPMLLQGAPQRAASQ